MCLITPSQRACTLPYWENASELWNCTLKYMPDLNQRHWIPSRWLNVLLCFSVGKSHRRDAPDSLQQAPHVAVTTSAEENVRCLWLLQVLWDWKNCDLQWLWKPGLTDMQMINRSARNVCTTPTLRAGAIVLAHCELKGKELIKLKAGEVN